MQILQDMYDQYGDYEVHAHEYNSLREAHPDLMHGDILKLMETWEEDEQELLLEVRQTHVFSGNLSCSQLVLLRCAML